MQTSELETPLQASRAKRLKARTQQTHERLDRRIMAAQPFASRDRYARFLRVQHAFHSHIDPLYAIAALERLLSDLPHRRRTALIERDLGDLGQSCAVERAPTFDADTDIATALGWLYVAEGSNLGAALLMKEAIRIGLSETFGARHLAAHPGGRGLYWRTFTSALDAMDLSVAEEERAVAGAQAAFRRVHGLVDTLLGA